MSDAVDVLETLFDEIVQENVSEWALGAGLRLETIAYPSGAATLGLGGGLDGGLNEIENQRSVEMEDVTAQLGRVLPHSGLGEIFLGGGSRPRETLSAEMAGGRETATTVAQKAERVAQLAVSAQLGKGGAIATPSAVPSRAVAHSATAFGGDSGVGRQSGATLDTARRVDRAIQRDARRYDGGFLLG